MIFKLASVILLNLLVFWILKFRINSKPLRTSNYFTKDELKHLNCSEFINNQTSINEYVENGRLKLDHRYPLNLAMDCGSIVQRIFNGRRFVEKRLKRPIAFVRNVFTSYAFQEMLLSSDYHPDNTYCYSVDKYSKTGLFENLQILSNCLPNVILNPTKYYFNSWGHLQNQAQFRCLELIMNRTWSHALFLQNNDLVLKPADQLSDLSELLNYTSAMFFEDPHEGWYSEKKADWTPAALKLFKNEAKVPEDILHRPLRIWKGYNEVIVSRIFIESILDKLNLEGIMKVFDRKMFGVDEMLVQTLYRNNLGLDAQPTSSCHNFVPDTFIRWTDWTNRWSSGTFYEACRSKFERHWICVMGVEYLRDFIMNNSFVIGNKVLENHDIGPVLCLRELFGSNKIDKKRKITRMELENYPQFREMEMKRNGSYEMSKFQCDK